MEKQTAEKILNHCGKQMAYMMVFTAASMEDADYPYEFAEVTGDREFWKRVLSIINKK